MSEKGQVVLSVVGRNRVGVLSELTVAIAREMGNILDIGQKIMGEYFFTLMMVELDESAQFSTFKKAMEALGDQGDYKVMVQHEKVFHRMHRL